MIFLDCPPGQRRPAMLIYYNAIIMKQGSGRIFCAGAVTIHHDSVLFQKAVQLVLEEGLCPVLMSLVLALGHLWSFLPPEELVVEPLF